ncbi:hypothetical protein VAR608DRAFT_3510 [Variovorax sp. HW608]|uniref:alpha/beta hydrolase n=1 Tax=Variovorax sp. HW608 TaxID=1034889 RepID=UPI00082018C4|nr:alpha/beta hydrolase [Variovorax sp. HW608]SCK37917.1 hypothetical protein VAR608DRAFT_3510 [Variovorax sp. HW608]
MNTSKIIAAAALSLLAVAGANAETYDGVHPLTTGASRADVQGSAVAAARAGNAYGDAANAGVEIVASTTNRAIVREEAVATAHNPLQSLDRRAFYRDQVPSAYNKPKVSFTRQAAL